MTISLYCDTCGFALPAQATSCSACGHHLSTAVAPSADRIASPTPLLPAASGAFQPGFLLAQRYRILLQIGQGGFATVYKAEDRYQKNALVAIKQINLGALSVQEMIDATDAYNREVTYLSDLQHENLPRIFDHFTDANNWYVAMEYIEGETLEEKLSVARKHRFSVKRTLEIGIALCTVLQYLHKQRPPIIFRDLKPANIMLSRTGRIYLIDFGIARRYRQGQGKDTGALGSPGYAAPEQYGRRAQTTPQTDVYGLGATLQTLLTGKEPLEVQIAGIPQKLAIPEPLQELLTQTLEHKASKRPYDMDEVKQELQRIKERLASQRIKHLYAFVWWLCKSAFLDLASFLGILFFLAIIFRVTNFFNSFFFPPYIFIGLSIIIGSMAWRLHQEMKSSSIRLSREEKLTIVVKTMRLSLLLVVLLGLLSSFLNDIQHTKDLLLRREELFVLGLAVLAGVFGCFILIVNVVSKGLWWLRQRRAAQHKTPRRGQSAPLQQQSPRHPF